MASAQARQCLVCDCTADSCRECKTEDCFAQNCFSCCCLESHSAARREKLRRGVQIQYFSISWMSVEVIGAIAAAALASSFALLAFGADSIVELISAFVVLRHITIDSSGSKTKGEGTALLTSLLLASIVPLIGVGSTYSYFVLNVRPQASSLGIAIALGSVLIMPFLWFEKKKIGEATGCLPLTIDAMESATCFFMALALLGGLVTEYIFKLGWIDYAATIVIVAFVAYEARESLGEVIESRKKNVTTASS